jgi:protein-L-isoaspartate(D-aspartate) O-methyltransferase
MIDSQLRVSGVNDPAVLAAMDAVVREDFVPAERRSVAYADRAIPLGGGRVLAPALTHGQMLVEAEVAADDCVLIVSGGSAYLEAVVRQLCDRVTVVEPASVDDVRGGPFTLVLIDGAIEQFPAGLAQQLDDAGRVVTGLVENGVTRLATGRKIGGSVALFALAEADFAPLPEFAAPRKWSF